MTRVVVTCVVLFALSIGAALSQPAAPSLYQRLGGYDGVTAFVGLVFPRVVQHPTLARYFGGHGKDSQQRQFQMVVELVCGKAGGPCHYTGRPMTTVHDGLGISAAEWDVFMSIIDNGLAEKAYPAPTRDEFRQLWDGMRETVVQK
jgi:hemoglobin